MKRDLSHYILVMTSMILISLSAGCGSPALHVENLNAQREATRREPTRVVRQRALKQAQEREVSAIHQSPQGAVKPKTNKVKPRGSEPKVEAQSERVAVLELRNMARLNPGEVRYLSNLLRQAAGRLPQARFLVMTNDSLEALIPPEVDLEACEGTCPIEIGRTIQADWLLVGEVVKFGRTLRVSLNLHNVTSGALTESATVKGRDAESLEGPLQGAAVGLFSALDPSLKRVAERLKRGFVFQRFEYEAMPNIPESVTGADVPERLKAQGISGVDFGSVDVEGLELYERAVDSDGNQEIQPEVKIKLWEEVATRVKGVASEARARADDWRGFIKRRDAERAQRASTLKQLKRLREEDTKLEAKRSAQLEKDWSKLRRLLRLKVVSDEDKLNWVEAFIEAYGAVRELNPHIDELSEWTSRLEPRFSTLVAESRVEAKRRSARRVEIEQKIAALEGYDQDVAHARGAGVTIATQSTQVHRATGIRWISIPRGSFPMGSNHGDADERPVRRVSVEPFKIAESEVTVAQYRVCVDAGVCTRPKTGGSCTWGKSGREDHPVNCVSWGQARTFSRWVGGELPTEAQWEYAARGGDRYEYAGSDNPDSVAWYSSNTNRTREVKTKRANSYGLYDMSGSVWEWTLDAWHGSYSGAPTNAEEAWADLPSCSGVRCNNDSVRHVNRGGSWANGVKLLRVALRDRDSADTQTKLVGFRPILSAHVAAQPQARPQSASSSGGDCRGAECARVKWVKIPRGAFRMGSNNGDADERPVRRVSVKAFKIAESEVTVAQYRACVDAGVCTRPKTGGSCTWGKSGYEQHPVNCVSWGQARTFSHWVGGDLPTEAQWEYAARGGDRYEYAGSDNPNSVAWYSSNTNRTREVKTKRANGYGLYDMSGSIWEWTLDAWHGSYSGAPRNAEEAWADLPSCSGGRCEDDSVRHVNRGGSWANGVKLLRVALRDRDDADTRTKLVGFRPVISSASAARRSRRASSASPRRCRGSRCARMKWVKIPRGSFRMGSNNGDADERPVRRVKVKAFKIAQSEVTVAQYRACVDAGVCTRPKTGGACTWGRSGHDQHPINCVSWGQARTFSRWVGGDLPTEAQWEYAARGGDRNRYEYAGSNNPNSVAWYSDNTNRTREVKTKRPNGYGLYDMSGSVWEWTLDAWHSNYSGAPRNAERAWANIPSCSGVRCEDDSVRHVNRGGCWANGVKLLRVALRDRDDADTQTKLVGFRPVISSRRYR